MHTVYIGTSKTDNYPKKQELELDEIYAQLSEPRISTNKDGGYILTVDLGETGRRLDKNVEFVNGFFLDFDKGIDEFTLRKKLKGIEFFAHTTYSHTDEYPRWRVFIPYAKPYKAAYHKRVYANMVKRFDGYEIDRRCETEAQLWYLPTAPSKENFRHFISHGRFLEPTKLPKSTIAPKEKPERKPKLGPEISVGERDEMFFKLARKYAQAGMTEAEALGGLKVTLEQYTESNPHDPFTIKDVKAKVKSAYRSDYSKGERAEVESEEIGEGGTFKTTTCDKLVRKRFKKIRWLVDQIIPEGVTILGARPKTGKTRLAFNLAIAVASGNEALDMFKTEHSKVLYLAADERSDRLAAQRIKQFKLGAPKLLHICSEKIPKLGEGFEEYLRQWMEYHPATGLVIIDTWQKINPPKRKHTDAYEHDGEYIEALQGLARAYQNAILIVHHTKKGVSDSYEESLLGSTALSGGPDTIITLNKASETSLEDTYFDLNLVGRATVSASLTVSLDSKTGAWSCLGESSERKITESKVKVWDLMTKLGKPVDAVEVADYLGKSQASVRKQLLRMEAAGEVRGVKEGRKKYYIHGYQRPQNSVS